MNRRLGWLMNEDYEGIGGYSSGYVQAGSYAQAPTTAPAYGYSNPLVQSQLQSFIQQSTTGAINAPQYSAPAAPAIEQVTVTGVKPMSYDYGGGYGSGSYTNYGQTYTGSPDYSAAAYAPISSAPVYDNTGAAPEQVTVTGNSSSDYVQAPTITGDYGSLADLSQTPTLPQYGNQTASGDGYGNYGTPSGPQRQSGGGSSGGSSGGGQAPQQQQKPSAPVQVNISIPRQSGSGYGGGNRYGRLTGNYGGSYGNQQSSYNPNAAANYNAPSIVPYLIVGGLGLLAYELLKKKHG